MYRHSCHSWCVCACFEDKVLHSHVLSNETHAHTTHTRTVLFMFFLHYFVFVFVFARSDSFDSMDVIAITITIINIIVIVTASYLFSHFFVLLVDLLSKKFLLEQTNIFVERCERVCFPELFSTIKIR